MHPRGMPRRPRGRAWTGSITRIDRPAGHILELLHCVVELHLLLLDTLTEGVQSLIGGSTHV